MQKFADRGHHVDIQILVNEVSAEFKKTIKNDWGATYQLVPPNVHRRNIAEIVIRTFKAHFIAILQGWIQTSQSICGTTCWYKQS